MKVVLFGASGYVGTAISKELIARGHEVVGVTRTTANPVADGVSPAQGSTHDADFVRTVSAGADAIVVATPGRETDGKALLDDVPSLLETSAAENLRLGIVGGAGGLNVAPGGPRLFDGPDFPAEFKHEAMSHFTVLEALRASGTDVDWFYVSPSAEFGGYNPGEATGTYRVGGDELLVGADGHSFISGADYAKAFVDELETPKHHRERFTVGY
jgi:putative NADH-flavin reductase